jgi:cell division protein FtsL
MKTKEEKIQPVMRLRSMFIGLCVLVVCIAGPLVLVWRQSYINQVSIRLESRADSLAALNREITLLNLERGRLSSAPRVERIARSQGLDYPASKQIEVLSVKMPRQKNETGIAGFWVRIRQSFFGESG